MSEKCRWRKLDSCGNSKSIQRRDKISHDKEHVMSKFTFSLTPESSAEFSADITGTHSFVSVTRSFESNLDLVCMCMCELCFYCTCSMLSGVAMVAAVVLVSFISQKVEFIYYYYRINIFMMEMFITDAKMTLCARKTELIKIEPECGVLCP